MLSDSEQKAFNDLVSNLDDVGAPSPSRHRQLVGGGVMSGLGFLVCLLTFASSVVVAMVGLVICYVGAILFVQAVIADVSEDSPTDASPDSVLHVLRRRLGR